jgi:hypothetical protein
MIDGKNALRAGHEVADGLRDDPLGDYQDIIAGADGTV